MLLTIYRLICGYLYVRVTSKNPEKMLNLCAARGINIWRVLLKNDVLYFKIGIKSFKALRILKRNISGRIHITKKVGLPFIIARNKKRYGIVAGFVIFLIGLELLSGFAWNICVNGNSQVKSENIVAALNKIGIYEGAKISQIDPEVKRNELLLEMKELSWAAINIEGTRVTVDVVETKFEEEISKEPSNLKASCDGIIKKIEVISGTTVVKVGDAVSKGDLLVSGFIEYTDGATSAAPSRGRILAEVEKEITLEQPIKVTEYIKNGREEKHSVLNFFGIEIPLFLGSVGESYISSAPKINISSGEPYLPVSFYTRTFYLTEKTTYNLSETEAKERLQKALNNKINTEFQNIEILEKKESYNFKDGKMFLKVNLRCIEDIIYEEKILLNTRN